MAGPAGPRTPARERTAAREPTAAGRTPEAGRTRSTSSSAPPRRESAAPARYGWLTRLGDRWNARADGRAGLPSLEPGRPAGTPSLEVLAQDFLARSHRERWRLDVELTPLLGSLAQLATRIAETEAAADRAAGRLAAWPVLPDAEQLATRRGGEVSTAVDVVAARRSREYEAERRPLVTEEANLRSAVTRMRVEMARTRSTVRAREIAGATAVRRLHAQTMRRISEYERHLVRRHPAGDRIGGILAAQHPRVPGWVLDAEDGPDPADPGGVDATRGVRQGRPEDGS